MHLVSIVTAYILDLIIGDPRRVTHPVVIIGNLISFCENILLRTLSASLQQKLGGILLALFIPSVVFISVKQIVFLFAKINHLAGLFADIWFIYTAIAGKELYREGKIIYDLLIEEDLISAQSRLKFIVGRDTENLTAEEVVRATVETIAENAVDGILSPLFFVFIGGAPLAMAYRAVNTLDSMVGYKNKKYIHLGRASAKLDDFINLIPARICALLMVITSYLFGFDWRTAYNIIRRDALKHPSPNSGYPESAVAGSLGIRLGGINYYEGVPNFREYIGEPLRGLEPVCIINTIKIVFYTSFLFLLGGVIIRGWFIWAF